MGRSFGEGEALILGRVICFNCDHLSEALLPLHFLYSDNSPSNSVPFCCITGYLEVPLQELQFRNAIKEEFGVCNRFMLAYFTVAI